MSGGANVPHLVEGRGRWTAPVNAVSAAGGVDARFFIGTRGRALRHG